ncbi:MAG: hypothetical protein IJY28_09435 [Clostridia bacterium]|nr:hypothetical protein [Clostridia bacterium]
MKQTCDCCGGLLRMKLFRRGAVCRSCGMDYSRDELNEKSSGIVFPSMETESERVTVAYAENRTTEPPCPGFNDVPAQFRMEVRSASGIDISGRVRQGGIGLGDTVYINGDTARPYHIWYVSRGEEDVSCAKTGDAVELGLRPRPAKSVMKKAIEVTSVPAPVVNGYNYPGTMQEYFLRLLTAAFPQYQIMTDETHTELKIPVSFMFYQDARPVLAVFLIDSSDSTARYQVIKATRLFAAGGVTCTHFFENYRNDASYVIDRVQSALG